MMSEILYAIVGLVLLSAIVLMYFLPAVIAGRRKHQNTWAIFFLNLVAGWTMVGWIACFIWACVGSKSERHSSL